MFGRIKYRITTWLARRRLEAANPRLAELNRDERWARRHHAAVRHIQAERSAIIHRAIGWRGAR